MICLNYFFFFFLDEAVHYLVENVLKAKIEDEIKDSIKLRTAPIPTDKSGCCKL